MHQKDTDTRSFARTLLFLQFGLYATLGLFTMMVMMFVVSGDSTIQKKQQYYAPINSNKVGDPVDFSNTTPTQQCNSTSTPLNNSYSPRVDDYVRWVDSLGRVTEGWVYFYSEHYITIEVSVKDKPKCEYTKNEKHKKIHCLVVCYPQYWEELQYIKNRRDPVDIDSYKSQKGRYSDPQ